MVLEKTLESPLDCKEMSIRKRKKKKREGNAYYVFNRCSVLHMCNII